MNIFSLIFALIAAVVFALASSPREVTPYASIPLGLLFLTLSWLAQLLITTTNPIHF